MFDLFCFFAGNLMELAGLEESFTAAVIAGWVHDVSRDISDCLLIRRAAPTVSPCRVSE